MNKILLTLLLFLPIATYAQNSKRPTYIISDNKQYIVSDKDGYVNLREEPSTKSPVLATISNNTIVYGACSKHRNWFFVCSKQGCGFIHKSRLIEIPQDIIKTKERDHLYMDWQISRILFVKNEEKDWYFEVYFCDQYMTYGFVVDRNKKVVASLFGGSFSLLDKYDTFKTEGYNFDEESPRICRYSCNARDKKNEYLGCFSIDIQGTKILNTYFNKHGNSDLNDYVDLQLIDDFIIVP